jgi:hypothetical protein
MCLCKTLPFTFEDLGLEHNHVPLRMLPFCCQVIIADTRISPAQRHWAAERVLIIFMPNQSAG